ncbi:MAG: putative Sec-independent protein translocase protein TatB [Actinomycetota bacterium]
MFNLSGSEIVVILLLALIVLGPEKLPEAIRRFGRVYGELRRMSRGFQSEFKNAFDEPARELRETAEMTRQAVRQVIDPAVPDFRTQSAKSADEQSSPGTSMPETAPPATDPASGTTGDEPAS